MQNPKGLSLKRHPSSVSPKHFSSMQTTRAALGNSMLVIAFPPFSINFFFCLVTLVRIFRTKINNSNYPCPHTWEPWVTCWCPEMLSSEIHESQCSVLQNVALLEALSRQRPSAKMRSLRQAATQYDRCIVKWWGWGRYIPFLTREQKTTPEVPEQGRLPSYLWPQKKLTPVPTARCH